MCAEGIPSACFFGNFFSWLRRGCDRDNLGEGRSPLNPPLKRRSRVKGGIYLKLPPPLPRCGNGTSLSEGGEGLRLVACGHGIAAEKGNSLVRGARTAHCADAHNAPLTLTERGKYLIFSAAERDALGGISLIRSTPPLLRRVEITFPLGGRQSPFSPPLKRRCRVKGGGWCPP